MDSSDVPISILCVDRGKLLADQVKEVFDEDQITIAFERSLETVVDRFEKERFDLMLFSGSMARNQQSGALDILELISAKCPQTQI
jgi:DNA-binding response OmpR family regulator